MAPFVVRRSERIDYRVPVTLFAERHDAQPVLGRSLDVSEGGMRVLAPIPMPVGAVVRCELTLDGRSALLEGRVAWLSQAGMMTAEPDADEDEPSHALGIGIRFETLTREESGALRKLISQATEGYQPAELELEGVRAPVAARAVPTPSGARISAALPWLKRGAPVGVRFVDGPDDVRGHISDALLRELPNGGRRLQIDVQAEPPVRARRDTQYGDALEFERARPLGAGAIDVEGVEAQPATAAASSTPTVDASAFEAPRSRIPTWLALVLGAMLGAAGTTAVMLKVHRAEPSIVRLTQSEAQAALQAGALGAAAGARSEPPAREPSTRPPGAISEAAASIAVHTENAIAAQTSATASPAAAAAPTLINSNGVTTVRIPFQGTLDAMTSRIWADPYALAIDLPRGSTSLSLGRHLIADPEGIVSLVRLQARDGALLVRLTLRRSISTHSVAIGGNLLELRVVASTPSTPSAPAP